MRIISALPLEGSEMVKGSLSVLSSFGHQGADMGMEIYLMSERLDESYYPGAKFHTDWLFHIHRENLKYLKHH